MGSKKEKKNKKEKPQKKNTSSGEQITMTGSIALSKLHHVMMTKKGKKGKVEGIFIPVKKNFLTKAKDGTGLYMDVRVIYKPQGDDYDQNGFISQSVGSALYKAAKDKVKELMGKTPILGSIKNWDAPTGGGNDNSGSAGDPVDEHDDLPF